MGGKKRRRKKKKGGGGGMPGMPGVSGPSHGGSGGGGGGGPSHHHVQALMRSGVLPMDEDLEREARELTEKYASPKEYAEACKKALVISELQKMSIEQLHKMADEEGVTDAHKYPRHELTFEVLKRRAATGGLMLAEGTLDIAPDGGYGFLRSPLFSYLPSPDDTYISAAQIRRMGLRKGMEIKGAVRAPKEGERFFALLRVDEVNGADPSRLRSLPIFEDLTPLHPEQRYVLETSPDEIEMRIVDLVAPIGRGQRGLIVAPPRTGKTVLLQKMTRAIAKNYPEVKLIVLLIDERPEEVTDFRRNTSPSVEVIASTFDEDSSRHVAVTEMVHEKSRRYVEFGQHVVILLDSITRLARAYNANMPHSGKIMTGGVDSNALQRPKKFFGNARAIENGGSLTILGTALVDTGSKADEVIFEEFKGTGNSELHLDRKLVDKRIWPAIDVAASGTRREELLLDPKELELTYRLRKVLADMNVVEAMELMKSRLKKCKTNAEFLMSMQMGA
ncbi:MAG: transcription termination factor Rho [Planctomycetes bacterium]|nr:transcription termination factor Rho [Planctomycetota bacterium]